MISIVRKNLMEDKGYSPYCGNGACTIAPRTAFNGEQFVCPSCGWTSSFPETFISVYKDRWNITGKEND